MYICHLSDVIHQPRLGLVNGDSCCRVSREDVHDAIPKASRGDDVPNVPCDVDQGYPRLGLLLDLAVLNDLLNSLMVFYDGFCSYACQSLMRGP